MTLLIVCFHRYLEEIGYTDTIIDVRSSRVRQLLGLQSNNADNDDNRQMVNGEGGGKRPSEGQGRRYVQLTSFMPCRGGGQRPSEGQGRRYIQLGEE